MKRQVIGILLFALAMETPAFAQAKSAGLTPGKAMVWEDRGALTAAKVYWGAASVLPDPTVWLPAPPFSKFEPDDKPGTVSPKARVTDRNKMKWTVKFAPKVNSEVHAEIAASRLAFALGFGVDEDFYVPSGRIQGITKATKLGKSAPYIGADGSFTTTRFKRHDKLAKHAGNAKGDDITWDEAVNPGVPAEQLSGLLIFDVMIHNFDAQPKNCKITIVKGPSGPVNWFIMSDMGGSFGDSRTKWNLADYQKETTYVKEIKDGFVILDFYDISAREAKVHQRVPLAHAQWFRKQLDKLTDDEIVAAFNAAFATPEMNAAYIAGEAAKIKQLTNPEVSAYAARFRKKIEEFNNKVPAAP